jgi:hypothetical protein
LTGVKKDPVGAHSKLHNPRTTPSWRKVTGGEEEEGEENTVNSGHYVQPVMSKGMHAGAKLFWIYYCDR